MNSTPLLALILVFGVAGCGGAARSEGPAAPASAAPETEDAAEEAAEPSSLDGSAEAPAQAAPPSSMQKRKVVISDDSAPQSLEEAEAELARAREQLDALHFDEPPSSPAGGAAAGEARASKPAARPGMPPCVAACRAFASLQRAAGSICRLAGDSSEQCSQAKGVVVENRKRVERCSCLDEPAK